MTFIDRKFLKGFNADALKALSAIAEKHGIDVTQGRGTFTVDGTNATIKFELATIGEGGQVQTPEAKDFARYATQYGLKPEHLGTVFTSRGEEFRITGIKPRRPKFPICGERVRDGRSFKFPASTVTANLTDTEGPEGLTDEIREGFGDLVGQLSPENLTCDGECTASQVRSRRAALMRQWRALEARAGRKVSEIEAWDL